MNQEQQILEHMLKVGPITQAEAVTEYGCYRLAARISDIRSHGWLIHDEMVTRKNRFGDSIRFKKYWIAEEDRSHGGHQPK